MIPLKLRGERLGNEDEDYLVVSSKVQTELPHEDSQIDFHPVTLYKPKSKPNSSSNIEGFEPIVDPDIPILDGRRETCFEQRDLVVPVNSGMIFDRNPLRTQSLANSAEEYVNEYMESKKILSDIEAKLTTEINDFNRDTLKIRNRQPTQRGSSTVQSMKKREEELSIRIRKWRRDEMALSATGETFIPCYQQFSNWLTKKEELSQQISLDGIFHDLLDGSEGSYLSTKEDQNLVRGYLENIDMQLKIRRLTACKRLLKTEKKMLRQSESDISLPGEYESKRKRTRELNVNLSELRRDIGRVGKERKNHYRVLRHNFYSRYGTVDFPNSVSGWSELWKSHNPEKSSGGTQYDRDREYLKKEGTYYSGKDDLDSEISGEVISSGGHDRFFSNRSFIPTIGGMSVENTKQGSGLWKKDRFTSTYGDWTSAPRKPSRIRSLIQTISEDK